MSQQDENELRGLDPSLVGSAYQALSDRRVSYDTLMWQVPALSLSGQAFLFTIALGFGNSSAARLIASSLAFIIALMSLQLMAKHRRHEELYSRVLEQFEKAIRLDTLLGNAPHAPPGDWALIFNIHSHWIVKRSSYLIWMFGLALFAIASLIVMAITLAYPRLLP